jgi:four helix bundle protein
MSGTYEDLTVWQKSVALALLVYAITKTFPRDEMYGLTSQVRRASVSIASNIAEGKGRASDPELLKFLSNARGSLYELRTQFVIAEAQGYVSIENYKKVSAAIEEVGRLLNGLMTAVRARVEAAAKSRTRKANT